jgi:hypothetical protein
MRSRGAKVTKESVLRKSGRSAGPYFPRASTRRRESKMAPSTQDGAFVDRVGYRGLFLQLPFEDLDFLRQRHIIADETFDLAHGM